jgi:hypothetical protein
MMTETGGSWASSAEPPTAVALNTNVPHTARMYDYYLGGKDNFPADRDAAEDALAVFPNLRIAARANRSFLIRATRFLAAEAGIRQFIDIGTGIPTSPNLHEVAQKVAPDARVVYTDNDPIVLTHARALLTSTPEGRTAYIDADLRSVETILAAMAQTLDLTRPVALSLIAILHFIADTDEPHGIVRRLMARLPSGSYLTVSHITADWDPAVEEAAEVYRTRGIAALARSRAEVTRFFDGLDLVDPAVVPVYRWRPDDTAVALTDAEVSVYGAVARKP